MTQPQHPLTYRSAGVDIERGDAFVEAIKPLARSTAREGCVSGLGGFGALFELPKSFRDPLLVAATDGVGTKLKLAFELDRHDHVGVDLVAMCANDVLAQGAEPLFFLDYFASGALDPVTAQRVVTGIAEGCRQAGAALIGGETAEMPGMYAGGEYDLAGFCVGAVERERVLDSRQVAAGDTVIGLASSGAHSNGYSLIREVISRYGIDMNGDLAGAPLADQLLAPTRIYVRPVLQLLQEIPVHAIAHITGGGLPGNLVRVLPADCCAHLDTGSWDWPALFGWLQETAGLSRDEMYRTFNCGIGLALVLPAQSASRAMELLAAAGEQPYRIGEISAAESASVVLDD